MHQFAGHSWVRILILFCGGLLLAHASPATGQTTGSGSSVGSEAPSRWLQFNGGAGLGYETGIGAPSVHLRGVAQFGRIGLTSAINFHFPQTAGQLTRGRLDVTLAGRYEWTLGRRWSLSPHLGLNVARSRWTRKAVGRERSETNVNLGGGLTVGASTEYKLTRRMDLYLRTSYRTAQQNQWSFQSGLTYTFAMRGRGEQCPPSGQPVGLFSCESCPCVDDCTPTGTREILQTHMGLTTSPRYSPDEWKAANVMVAAVLALTGGG